MRLGIVTFGSQTGGTRTHLRHLVHWLKDFHEITVISVVPGYTSATLMSEGVISWAPPRADERSIVKKMSEFMCDRHLDIVHTHDSYGGYFGRRAVLLAGLPLVHTHHASLRHAGPVGVKLADSVRRMLDQQSNALIGVSNAICAELLDAGLPKERVFHIPNGVPVPNDMPEHTTTVPRQILWLGRFSSEKNPLMFLRVAKLVSTYAEAKAMFRMVGSGLGGKFGQEVLRAREQLGLADIVVIEDHIESSEPLLSRTDLIINTSLTEGTPYSILEAMAAGVPCVATAVGGVPELIEDGVSGILCGVNQDEEMADAIVSLLRHPAYAHSLAANAFERIKTHLSVNSVISKTTAVYDQVLGKKVSTAGADALGKPLR